MRPKHVLASDIDNTLTGDAAALRRLSAELARERAAGRLFVVLSTGRRLDEVVAGFEEEGIPLADAVIGQVGTEIYLPPFAESSRPLEAWDELLHRDYRRAEALEFLQGIDGLEMQPARYNTPLKVSCFLDGAPDPDRAAATIAARVAAASAYQTVWSSGRHLDILPAASGKGLAIRFLLEHLGLSAVPVLVAGDSGNDWSMFDEFGRGIVVANAQPELCQRAASASDGRCFYMSSQRYAAGVLEGLRHFGVLNGPDDQSTRGDRDLAG